VRRLLSILMLLQSHGRLSAPALARTLEVSVRTILRDIDQLSAAGVPLWGSRVGSDFQLREGWSTSLTSDGTRLGTAAGRAARRCDRQVWARRRPAR
jgi:predicted DNA-binding transcriptional regulator YafY